MPSESVADRVASEIMATYSINRKTLEITEVTNEKHEAKRIARAVRPAEAAPVERKSTSSI
jgi:hypothetical protein